MCDVVDGCVTEFIGCAVGDAGFDTASGHEHAEAFDVVVASGGSAFALEHGCATEFAAPDDESVVEHAALF